MKLATLLATSLLGLSSVAAAEPAIDFQASASFDWSFGHAAQPAAPIVVRDHRAPARVFLPPPVPRPLPPMAITKLGTVATGKQALAVPGAARFDRLVLDIDGVVYLKQVTIVFANGERQLVRFGATYTGRMASPEIDLAGANRNLERIVVNTADTRRGSVTVIARDDRPRPAPPANRWTKLGALPAGMHVLRLDTTARYDRLAIAASGRVHLKQVLIRFANGGEQLAKLDLVLTAGSRTPIVDLAGADRRITSVVVYTDDQRGGLTLYAI
jgi:hypothetical protein